jgi:hypothetical protein
MTIITCVCAHELAKQQHQKVESLVRRTIRLDACGGGQVAVVQRRGSYRACPTRPLNALHVQPPVLDDVIIVGVRHLRQVLLRRSSDETVQLPAVDFPRRLPSTYT